MNVARVINCTCALGTERLWPEENETLAALHQLNWPATTPRVRRPSWIGAIISVNATNDRYAATAAAVAACGFLPVHVPAAMPQHFGAYSEMLQELFGTRNRRVVRLSPFELGLVISHKRALSVIARGDYAWGVVFEDDVYLHEAVPPLYARRLIHRAFAAAGAGTVLYLGTCAPRCFVDDSRMTNFAGMPPGLVRGDHCRSYCTHAYGMSRAHASDFFADVFDCHGNVTARCGKQCEQLLCFSDWAMDRHFVNTHSPVWVVGGGLRSSWNDAHRGLFLQHRPNKGKSTRLHRSFAWPAAKQMPGCDAAPDSGAAPLRQVIVNYQWTGRLGNLLFGWAGLVGVAARLRRMAPETRAVALHLPSTETVPAKELFVQFPLGDYVHVDVAVHSHAAEPLSLTTAHAEDLRACTACLLTHTEQHANTYDDRAIKRLEAWVARPPRGCVVGLVDLVGYFQSFKYWLPVAERHIRSAFAVPKAATRAAADAVLTSARHGLPPGTRLVGVQVRLGDKIKGFSDHFYAPTGFGYYRMAMAYLANALSDSNHGVAFVITSGGSFGSNAGDVVTARNHLAQAAKHVFFSTANDPYVDLAVLRSCDGLVIGPSSLGWWAAYLARLPAGRVVAPSRIYQDPSKLPRRHVAEGTSLFTGFVEADYFPPGWLLLDNDAGNGSSAAVRRVGEVRNGDAWRRPASFPGARSSPGG